MAAVPGGANSSSVVAGGIAKDFGHLIMIEDELPQLEQTVSQLHALLEEERNKN